MNKMWMDNILIEDNKGYFTGGEVNALFECDTVNQTSKIIANIPNSDFFAGRQYRASCKLDDKIFLLPIYGDRIYVYHLEDGKFTSILLGENCINPRIMLVHIYDGIIYAISNEYKTIISINPEAEEVIFVLDVEGTENNSAFVGIYAETCNIYMVSVGSNKIINYNLQKKNFEYIELPGKSIRSCLINQGDIWLLDSLKRVIRCKANTGENIIIDDFKSDISNIYGEKSEDKFPWFIRLVDSADYIWCIPYKADNIICINKKTNKANVFQIENEEEDEETLQRTLPHKYLIVYEYENRYLGLCSLKNNCIYEIDMEKLVYNTIDMKLELETEKYINEAFCNTQLKHEGMLREDKNIGLGEFLMYLKGNK